MQQMRAKGNVQIEITTYDRLNFINCCPLEILGLTECNAISFVKTIQDTDSNA